MQTLFDMGIDELTSMTPLRYTGGKTQAKKDIYRFFRDIGAKTVVSPFCGGCSFELYAGAKGIKVIANDNLHELMVFWELLKQNPSKLVEKIRELLDSIGFIVTKDLDIIAEMLPKCDDALRNAAQRCLDADTDIDKAGWLYIRNRTAYQAVMFHFKGCLQVCELKIGTKITDARLDELINFRTTVEFEELDFKQCIEKHTGSHFYLDPPYLDVRIATKYGKEGDEAFDHELLRDMLCQEKYWILSYNDVEGVRELYDDYRFLKAEWHHPSRKTQSTRGNEVFIMPNDIYKRIIN